MPGLDRQLTKAVSAKAERRHLTVLFCDIVGSTALSAQLDPEDLRQILHTFQVSCSDAIRRYDGHIARYMGDGVLAYFGFPTAHEDDAERAVRAAFQMIESISAVSFPRAPSLQLRVGIATGVVVVGDLIGEGPNREFELIGEAPNLAAWLQKGAKPNQILVSPNTRRLLGRVFEFEDLGERSAKGTGEPTRIWSVLRPSAVPSRFEARQPSQLTPFVGRDLELALLRAHFEKAKHGFRQIVTISGEPGIGKSRLIVAFRQQLAGESCRTLLFQCSSYHANSPWYPVIRHLEDALGIGYDASPSLKLQKLEALIDEYVTEQRISAVPLLAALLAIPTGDRYPAGELTPQQQKKRTFDALLDLVRAQSEQAPLILIVEDIHWMDPTSSELLEQLCQRAKEWRVLVVLSFRPEYRLPQHEGSAAINLNRLETAQVASLIDSLAPDRTLPVRVTEQIIAKTDGVPLFVEEVTKTILDDRAIKKGQNIGEISWSPVVPDTLHDSLMARLDQLGPTKVVAQIAATIGREFAFNLLAALTPLSQGELRRAIDHLQGSGLLFRRDGDIVETYFFKHALVQDAAYASLLRDDRRKLHLRIAEALSTKFHHVSESSPEIIAYHYTEARETKPAVLYWLKAGQHAIERTAFVEAITHFQTALKLLSELPECQERDGLELQLQQAHASAAIAARGFGAAETKLAFNRALQLCEKLESAPQAFAILYGLASFHLMRGEFEEGYSVAQDLLQRAKRQNDPTGVLIGHRVVGMSLFMLGELKDARRELQRASELYDPERHAQLAVIFSQDLRATAQVYLGMSCILLGDVEVGLTHSREALAYAEQLRHPHTICYILPFLAGAYLYAGMPRTALPLAERTITLSAEYGFPQWLAAGLMVRGWSRVDLGDVQRGLTDIRESIGGLQTTGTIILMQFAQFLLARALMAASQLTPALELVDRILSEIRQSGGRWYEAEVHRLKGDLLERAGRSGFDFYYKTAIAVARRQGVRLWIRATSASTQGPS
jgi:class 3 adenylate cyclase/predicted ATPase